MRKYIDKQIQEAISLRKTHKYSFKTLAKITGIPANTIRGWCKDEVMGTRWDTLLISNERKRQDHKDSEKMAVNRIKSIDKNLAKVLAALIYWCEGTKYPSENRVTFINSDPKLSKLFLELLRKAFPIDESRLRVHLQIHDTHKFGDIREYWSKLLSIPESQFIKPTITKPNGGKHRTNYLGTCSIRYTNFKVQLKLIGIYEEFANRFLKD